MPTPKPGEESRDEWMDRCIPKVLEDGAASDQDQAVAVCSQMWRDATKSIEGIDVMELSRAYSVLEVRQVDSDKRQITGIATTPEPDRLGDIVEPLGIQYKNPLPLLLHHRADQPVGSVRFKKPTEDGVEFTAELAKIEEPGALKNRVDEAWQSIKAGLIRGVSIGFRALERSVMKDGGLRFLSTEVLELSLVTIPANASTTIDTIRSIDTSLRAASGNSADEVGDGGEPPGVTGKKVKSTKVTSKEGVRMTKQMTIGEQITAFENTRAAKAARMNELMTKAADSGETLDETESDEYDGLEKEVKKIDEHLKRLQGLEAQNKAAAKIVKADTAQEGSEARAGGAARISVKANVPDGIRFVRHLVARYQHHKHGIAPWEYAKQVPHWSNTPEMADPRMYVRAAVDAGTTAHATWAGPLVEETNLVSEFAELLRARSIIGRIPGLRRVPFNIKVPRQTGGSTVNWIGEGKVKPVSALAFDQITMLFTKVAGIVPITEELLRFSSPSAEEIIRNDLRDEITEFTDREFLDPTKAAATGVSPASVTNGVTPVAATGTTADAFRTDLNNLLNNFSAANISLGSVVLVMTESQALALSMMTNTLGQDEFPDLTGQGGTIRGIPVVTSENITAQGGSPALGNAIVAIAAREVLLADDGGVSIDVSREASLQMNDAPDSPAVASTVLVSLWQHNMVAIKAERFINWLKRRADAVQYISYARYVP